MVLADFKAVPFEGGVEEKDGPDDSEALTLRGVILLLGDV